MLENIIKYSKKPHLVMLRKAEQVRQQDAYRQTRGSVVKTTRNTRPPFQRQHQDLITSRVHAYKVWSTSTNTFVSYLAGI